MVWVGGKGREIIRMALGFCLSRKTGGGVERFFGGGKIKYVKSEMLLRHSSGLWTLDV